MLEKGNSFASQEYYTILYVKAKIGPALYVAKKPNFFLI